MKKNGIVEVPREDNSCTIVHYYVEVCDECNELGINKGHILRLTLKQGGKIVYSYDKGLVLGCQTYEAEKALESVIDNYN